MLTGPDFEFGPAAPKLLQLSLWSGSAGLGFGTAAVNGFNEDAGLLKKVRWHGAADGLSVSMELETLLPFGAEFRITRKMELWDGAGMVSFDVNAGMGGRIQSLELEPLELSGDWRELRLVRDPAAPETVEVLPLTAEKQTVYAAPAPFFRLVAVDHSDRMLEVGTGDDWWRWNLPEANGEFHVEADRGSVTIRRRALQLVVTEEQQPTKRPYRFTWYFAWSAGAADAAPEAEAWASGAPAPCLKAAATQRLLKKHIRQADSDVVLAATPSVNCTDAGHLERPDKGELAHHDAMERARFYLWSNRQLARQGHTMRWIGAPLHLALETALSRVPRTGCEAQITE